MSTLEYKAIKALQNILKICEEGYIFIDEDIRHNIEKECDAVINEYLARKKSLEE